MDDKYKLLIKMKNGEKIEAVVSESIINYLQVTHDSCKKYENMNFLMEIDGREINVGDINYFVWQEIVYKIHTRDCI